jgi:hypothetical protein
MPKSQYWANTILDFTYGGVTSVTPPATLYFDAMTVPPTITGGGTSAGFGRIGLTNNLTNFPSASGGTKSTGVAINFGTNTTGSTQVVVDIAIYDASTGGNLIAFGLLSTSVTVPTGAPFVVPINGGVFTET